MAGSGMRIGGLRIALALTFGIKVVSNGQASIASDSGFVRGPSRYFHAPGFATALAFLLCLSANADPLGPEGRGTYWTPQGEKQIGPQTRGNYWTPSALL